MPKRKFKNKFNKHSIIPINEDGQLSLLEFRSPFGNEFSEAQRNIQHLEAKMSEDLKRNTKEKYSSPNESKESESKKESDISTAQKEKEKELLVLLQEKQNVICEHIYYKNKIYEIKEIKFKLPSYSDWRELYEATYQTLLNLQNKEANASCFCFWKPKTVYPGEVITFIKLVKSYCKFLSFYPNPLFDDLPAIHNGVDEIIKLIPKVSSVPLKPTFKAAVKV